jgi:hypothetical protein
VATGANGVEDAAPGANSVEDAVPGPSERADERAEEPALDLTTMFPSSKRKPMGDLAGFDQVMKVKKPRQKRTPKPKYDPTPSLLDDDLVAIAPAVKDTVKDFIAEDDYDNISAQDAAARVEEDVDVADTDVEDSPQVTEIRAEFLFPSSVPKKKMAEKNEESLIPLTQTERTTNEEIEVVTPTKVVATTHEDDGEEATRSEIEPKHASDGETSIAHWNSESNSPGNVIIVR